VFKRSASNRADAPNTTCSPEPGNGDQKDGDGVEHARLVLSSDSRPIKGVVKAKQVDPRGVMERRQRLDEDRCDIVEVRDESPDTAKWDQPNCVLTVEIVPEDNWHRCGEHARGAK
jgi:hypothetical protein